MSAVAIPPKRLSVPKAATGKDLWNPIVAPMKGAERRITRAKTTHENKKMGRFSGGTTSPEQVKSIDWDVETAIFAKIAVINKYIFVSV